MNKLLQFFISWLAGFFTLTVLDVIWLGYIIQDIIQKDFAPFTTITNGSIDILLGVGLLAWAIISLGCVYFASYQSQSFKEVLSKGALFGFVLYGCYELTNLTFFTNYPVRFVALDIFWGIFVCTAVSLSGFMVKEKLKK